MPTPVTNLRVRAKVSVGCQRRAPSVLRPVDTSTLEPLEEFWRRTKATYLANCEGVMKAGGLVVEHDVVGTGHAHEVVTACGGQQKHQIVGGVLIGDSVIGGANVTSHR